MGNVMLHATTQVLLAAEEVPFYIALKQKLTTE
jgi:hypothetical protein